MGYQLGLYEKSMPSTIGFREKLWHTKQAGFDFMEISIDETEEKLSRLLWTPNERRRLVETMWETDTRILTMCLSGHRKFPLGTEVCPSRALEIMEQAIILASDLGIRVIQIAGYDEYYNESNERTRANFLCNLRASVQIAAKYSVVLAFETMETEFMNTVGKAMHYVEKVASPYLQLYPDIGNLTNAAVAYGTKLEDDLRLGAGHYAALHLKETTPGIFREVPFGTGHVNFDEAAKMAKELGVGMFVGEFWYVGNENWEDDLAAANKFLRQSLDLKYTE